MQSKFDYNALLNEYNGYKQQELKLDMSRGKPAENQLDTAERILTVIQTNADCFSRDGIDCRNYGNLTGIPEVRELFSNILGVSPDEVIAGGNSSLNLMYDTVARAMSHGVKKGSKPWSKYDKISFLCPVPGYDRHFAICEYNNINMINVPMIAEGPDMDVVEMYIKNDDTIKGIWCVPKYSNPTGITYSDETVMRFANLKPKADDFRVFWDNAYALHDINDKADKLLNVLEAAKKVGNEDLFYIFTSTSKISYAGAGIAALACSKNNINAVLEGLKVQTIGYDKINQLRHCRMFPTFESVLEQMQKHLKIVKPKFVAVLEAFEKNLSGVEDINWTNPNGGYFISLNLPNGTAKRVVQLAKEAGVTLTPAGATYPYGVDPEDRNIRVAPTYPSLAELNKALPIMCCCAKLAIAEKQIR
ncbi:MAG: aminotransferase [Clostridiales bacterium GWF2_38_85]|nr:MAG: aminotransferase [Clostridiales bacterium GWF2_38_85]HBL83344.1 aminotransferase [Clostridiales bacterium]